MITRHGSPAAQSTCSVWTGITSRTAVLALAGTLAAAVPAGAAGDGNNNNNPPPPPPVQARTAHIVEWDLPAAMDASPGAMLVDSHGHDKDRLFFVTRLGVPRVFRMNPWKTPMKGSAQWTSWELSEDSFTTGGVRRLKASHDRRYLIVRTATSIQRVDTQNCSGGTCARAEWPDQAGSLNVSDLGIDDHNNVFTAGFDDPSFAATTNYIQKLAPSPTPANGEIVPATVTRWSVGGGAGFCEDLGRTTTSFPCLSGVYVHPNNRNLIYYSEPQGNNIGELNIATDTVRRWSLSGLMPADPQAGTVQQPRQLIMDKKHILWVITGSGHLVSLEPAKNRIRVHTIPMGMAADPFGIAPDDNVIGYTDSARNMVGMLYPLGPATIVPPTSGPAPRTTVEKTVIGARSTMVSGAVPPVGKVVEATIYTKADGVFVEAQLDSNGNDDMSPLGITANKGKGQGTFFYAVGMTFNATVNRIGFIRFPKNHVMKMTHPRDDDDPEDGWEHAQHPPGWHISDDGDDDSDGLGNAQDTASREDVVVSDDAPLEPGQTSTYWMTASSSTLALVALVTANDPLAVLRVDIYNPLGLIVATSPATPGVGLATVALPAPGNYTVKVQNMGFTANTHSPMLINREPWQ